MTKIKKGDIEKTIASLPEIIELRDGKTLISRRRISEAINKICEGGVLATDTHSNAPSRIPIMLSSDFRKIGLVLNKDAGPCRMEGCTGHRQYVRWEDGKATYPCTKGCSAICDGIDMIGFID